MKNESINSEQSPIVGRLVQAGQLKDTHGETVHGVLIDCGEAMLQNVKLPLYQDVVVTRFKPTPGGNNGRLVRPGERLLIAITFPSDLEESESCHPDIVLEDFLASRNDGSWEVEVLSIFPTSEFISAEMKTPTSTTRLPSSYPMTLSHSSEL